MPATQKTGNFLLDLLKGVVSPFRKGVGIGQEIAYGGAQKLGLADAKQVARARQLAQQKAQALSLTPEEKADPLLVPKTIAGQGAFFIPAGKAIKGAGALQKILAAAGSGAAAGGLAGFGGSESGQEVQGSLGGAAIGGALGGVLGAASTTAKKLLGSKTPSAPTITGAKLKADPFFETAKKEMAKTAQEIGITNRMSSTQKVQAIEDSFKSLQKNIGETLKGSKAVPKAKINEALATNFNNSNIDESLPSVQRLLKQALGKLNTAADDNVALNELKSFARKEMGNIFRKGGESPTQKQEVWGMVYNTVKDALDTVSPQIRSANNKQKILFDLADEFVPAAKAASDKVMAKLPGIVDVVDVGAQTPITREGASRALGAVGRASVSPITVPAKLATQAMAAIPPQLQQILSTAGVTSMSQGEQPQDQPQLDQMTQQPAAETIQPDRQKAMAIIDQMEAQATGGQAGQPSQDQLGQAYLAAVMSGNTKAATQLKAMYDFNATAGKQEKKSTAEKSAEGVMSLASQANELLKNKDIKTGMIAGPIEQQKAKFGKADQATLDFQTIIGNLKGTIVKARAGAALSKNEEKLLDTYVPIVGDSKQQLETKLRLLQTDEGKAAIQTLMNPTIQQVDSQGLSL